MDQEIADLLHDAELVSAALSGSCLSLHLRGLRYGASGPLADPLVELRFQGVLAIAASYEGTFDDTRPSTIAIERALKLDMLRAWPFEPCEIEANPEGRASVEDAIGGARVDWLVGDEPACLASPHHLVLRISRSLPGMAGVRLVLLAGYTTLDVRAGGASLSRDRWRAEFDAWWAHWKAYWDERRGERSEHEPDGAPFEAAIPIAADEEASACDPPDEPPFDLLPTDAPEILLAPIRAWFEGMRSGDFARAAAAFPGIAESIEARAMELGDSGDRPFCYARAVDTYWMEGRRACVKIRGIEHTAGTDDDDGSNEESVWTFSLRPNGAEWVIRSYSQGWPRHGSASALAAEQKPWLASFCR